MARTKNAGASTNSTSDTHVHTFVSSSAADADLKAELITQIEFLTPGEVGLLVKVVKGIRKNPIDFLLPHNSAPSFGIVAADPGATSYSSTIANRMLSAVPRHDATMKDWNDLIGPFYDTAALTSWLGVTKQAISKRGGKTLLAVRAENGHTRYPSFQFLDDGRVIPHLMAACKKLADIGIDEWAQAQWLNTPVPDLGNRTIAETFATEKAADIHLANQIIDLQVARLAA